MPLMKEDRVDQIAHEAVVLDLGDLRRQAEQLKAQARAEADRIIAEARAEGVTITEAAQRDGYEAGYATGKAEGLEAGRTSGHDEALQSTREAIDRLEAAWLGAARAWELERRDMVLDARESLLELAVAIARRVVKRVPEVEPNVVADQVDAALEHVARPHDAAIRIHPEDRALVEEVMPRLVQALGGTDHVRLIDDASIQPGGCVVTSGRGRVDATLGAQLDRMVELLLPSRRQDTPGASGASDVVNAVDTPGPPDATDAPGREEGGDEPT